MSDQTEEEVEETPENPINLNSASSIYAEKKMRGEYGDEPEVSFEADIVAEDEVQAPAEPQVPEEFSGKAKDELVAEIEKLRKDMEEGQRRSDEVQALKAGIEGLGEKLSQPVQPQTQQPPQRTREEIQKEFNEKWSANILEDPFSAIEELNQMRDQAMVTQRLNEKEKLSRRMLQLDPEKRETAGRYMSEIDLEVSNMNPYEKLNMDDPYSSAHDRVLARHINDVMDEKVAKIVEEKLKERGAAAVPTTPTGSPSNTPPAGPTRPQVRVSAADKEWAMERAAVQGFFDPRTGAPDWKRYLRYNTPPRGENR
jgi:hypothetical protein